MTLSLYISGDTTARALGADALVAVLEVQAAAADVPLNIIRSGSRGAFWLEPMLEMDWQGKRIGIGELMASDAEGLLATLLDNPESHPNYLGEVAELPWFANQHRLTFARAGEGDPIDLNTYRALGGLQGLERALSLTPDAVVEEITDSGLRGRGGAAFPAGIKWRTVLGAEADQKYIVCNADEGDSGTFADRSSLHRVCWRRDTPTNPRAMCCSPSSRWRITAPSAIASWKTCWQVRESRWRITSVTPVISSCGSRRTRRTRAGIALGAEGAPVGILNAQQ